MDMISLEGKTNFFEKRVAEYQKSGVMESLKEQGSKSLDFDAEFWAQMTTDPNIPPSRRITVVNK